MRYLLGRALPRLVRGLTRLAPPGRIDFSVTGPTPDDQIIFSLYWNGNRRYPLMVMGLTPPATDLLIEALAKARITQIKDAAP